MERQAREKDWGPVVVGEPGSHAGDVARLVARNLGYEVVIADETIRSLLGVRYDEVLAAGVEQWYREKVCDILVTTLLPLRGVVLSVSTAALTDLRVQRTLETRRTFWVGARPRMAARSICTDEASRCQLERWLQDRSATHRGLSMRYAGIEIDMNVVDMHAAARLICTGYLCRTGTAMPP